MDRLKLLLLGIAVVIAALLYSRYQRLSSHQNSRPSGKSASLETAARPSSLPNASQQQPTQKPVAEKPVQPNPSAKVPDTPAPPKDDGHLPRGPEEPREKEFINKYAKQGIDSLITQEPQTKFPGIVAGALLLLNEALVLGGAEHGEFRFRRSVSGVRDNEELQPWSCIAVAAADNAPVVGSLGKGNLKIRKGPLPNSFLLSISEQHYFLTYFDMVRHRESQNNVPADPGSDSFGALLYFLRGADGKITYQGRPLRWDDGDTVGHGEGLDFCTNTFGELR